MNRFAIVVPDSSPLITLAAADALDLLLKPGLPVLVPDGVHWEVTRFVDRQGASEVVEWLASHEDQVLLRATQEFLNYQTLIASGVKRVSDLGERCAREIVEREAERHPGTRSILLYEDSDVTLLRIANPALTATLTTADFLFELERARLIQSADKVLDDAVAAGRGESIRRMAQPGGVGAFDSGLEGP